MTAALEIFDYIKGRTGKRFSDILPEGAGFAARIVTGSEKNTFMNGAKEYVMPLLFLGKSKKQKELASAMFAMAADVSAGGHCADGWEIRCVNISASPSLVTQDEQGFFTWSFTADVHFYLKGV